MKSEMILPTLLINHPTPTLVCDAASGLCKEANRSGLQLLGYTQAMIKAAYVQDILGVDRSTLEKPVFEARIKDKNFSVHRESIEQTGGKYVVFYLIQTPSNPGLTSQSIDSTVAEESLQDAHQRLKETLEFARMGSCEIDPAANTVKLSPELMKLLDREESADPSMTLQQFMDAFIAEEEREYLLYFIHQSFNPFTHKHASASGRITVRTTKGRQIEMYARTIDREGKKFAIFQDISDEENTKVLLAKKSTQVENILNSITDGFFALDRNWNFVFANELFLSQTGKKHDEVVGKNIWEIFPDLRHGTLYERYSDAMTNNHVQHFDIPSSRGDRHFEVSAFPHADGLLVYFRDVSETRQAVSEMLKSQEQLQTIVDNIPMHVYVKDLHGRYMFYNRSFAKQREHQKNNDEQNNHLAWIEQEIIRTGRSYEEEEDRITSGVLESFYTIRFPLHSTDGSVYAIGGVEFDITERKRMELALRKSEERMRLAQQAAKMGIWEWHIPTGEVIWNENMYSIFGISPDEPQTFNSWMKVIHPDDVTSVEQQLDDALSAKSNYHSQHRIVRSDKTTRTIIDYGVVERDAKGQPVRMIGVDWDITDEKEREAQQTRLNKIVRETFNEIYLIKDPTLQLDYANPAALQNLGYNEQELTSLRLTDLFNYPDEMALTALLNTLRKAETDRIQLQLKFQRRNGTHYDAEVTIQVLEKGRYFMAIVTDITSKLITEKKLMDTISEKETLIKEIHHRVKNNLQLISSILYLKLVSLGESDIRFFLEDTRQKIRSIALIHERLLQTQSLDRVEISDYLGKLIHDLRVTYFNPGLELEIQTDIETKVMGLDTAIICGLIVNELITNSLKHAFKGRKDGSITIGFRGKSADSPYVLTVADNGISLPKEVEPGASASFGMQLIDVFVKQLGGQISIFRVNGTKFQIEFKAD